ncbi:MAG: response regulator [Patescibacteria group bacterium]|nr:response regulator [Patescibacteria group bacterium]
MRKVLIVEDDNILSKAVNAALVDNGFETLIAVDGEDALVKAKQFKPDLVLLDLLMPKKSGEEVLTVMKKDDELKDIPVLISTVKSDADSIARCTALGIKAYFIKAHYTLEEIVKEVKKVLK